ncbi:MAG: glycosyltransferase family 39 protein [Armatimonadota bacterium]|nr:MAG: glycosyltransferase family 39 protein [Armatimonadota bacterium]
MSRALLLHVSWIGPGAIALALQFTRAFKGLYRSEAMDLAQLGRHLAEGQGFVTSLLRPVEVALFPRVPAPEIYNAPLYPLTLGVAFGALPHSDAVVAGVSAVFFLATLIMVYVLASRIFDRATGALAAALFALNVQALAYAVSGLHVTLWAFLLTLMVYLIYVNSGSLRLSAAAGAVLALCWLTEYMTFALVLPAIAVGAYAQKERRLRHAAWFAAGLIVVMTPWWVRNYLVARDPLFTLERYLIVMFTGAHPGHTLFRAADASALRLVPLIVGNLGGLLKKIVLGLASAYRAMSPLVGLYVVGFVVISAMRTLNQPRQNLARNAVLALVLFLILIGAVHNPTPELFFVIVPLLLVLCAGYFMVLVREWIRPGGWQAVAVLFFVGVAAYPAAVSWAAPEPKFGPDKRNLSYLEEALPRNAVVVTDAPWAVAWYAHRPAVWLPLGAEDFEAVDEAVDVRAIYFSTLLQTYPASEEAVMWQRIYLQGAAPPGFEVTVARDGELIMLRSGADATSGGP